MRKGSVARKLAHEIKSSYSLQLSIDSLREKYKNKLTNQGQIEKYLQTINRQIKDIEKLVNEFSTC